MNNITFKIGDRVRIISTGGIPICELNKIGTLISINDGDPNWITCVVDMGRPRRPEEPGRTCWRLGVHKLELANKPGQQLTFDFMNE